MREGAKSVALMGRDRGIMKEWLYGVGREAED